MSVEDVCRILSGELAQSYILGSWLSWDPEICNLLPTPTYEAISMYLMPSPPLFIKLHKALP